MTSQEGSITGWIGGLKAGDEEAAQRVWERYFDRLVQLARDRLRAARRAGADQDEEDVALSALNSVCLGAAGGRFPRLADRNGLWMLLVVIAARKAVNSAILLDVDGTPKLGDFGLAKDLEEDSGLTRTDTVLGSPSYMSPEQAEGGGRRAGPTSDVYALGAIFYELLTGRPPFRAATVLETPRRVRTAEPVAPSRLVPGLPRDAESIALKCLEKASGRRYAPAEALDEDLRRFLDHRPILARRTGPAGRARRWCRRSPGMAGLAAAVLLLLLAVTAVSLVAAIRVAASASKERRTLYFARMNLVQQAWESANVRRMRELLAFYDHDAGRDDLRGFEWYFWWRRARGPAAGLRGHRGKIEALALSPDGRTLASAGDDRAIILWDRATSVARATLASPVGLIDSLAFSPDGEYLVAGGEGGSIQAWSLGDHSPRPPLRAEEITPRRVLALAFLDAKTLASAHDTNIVRTWELGSWGLARESSGGRPPSGRVEDDHLRPHALSPDGRLLAFAGPDGQVVLREAGAIAMELARPASKLPPIAGEIAFNGSRSTVRALAFSPDGQTLAVGGEDHSIALRDVGRLRDAECRGARLVLRGHTASVWSFAFSPDGRRLAAASLDNTATLWDAQSGRLEATLKGHSGPLLAVAFDGRTLASGGDDGVVNLWDVARDGPDSPMAGHSGGVGAIALSPDGKTMVTAGRDGRAAFWDVDSAGRRKAIEGPSPGGRAGRPHRLCAVAYALDGRVVITAGWNGPIRIWDAGTCAPLGVLETGPPGAVDADTGGHQGVDFVDDARSVVGLAVSPDGKTLASGGRDNMIRLWDPASADLKTTIKGHTENVMSLAFTPDGRTLASGSLDGTARSWRTATEAEARLRPARAPDPKPTP